MRLPGGLPGVLLVVLSATSGLAYLWTRLRAGAGAAHTHGESRWATAFDTKRLGRSAHPGRMHGDGIVMGWWRGRVLQSPREDNVLAFGVQRSGKTTTIVVPTLLAWRGAALATSTKDELVRLTGPHRAAHGPVYVFAPLDDDLSWVTDLGLIPVVWNPVEEAVSAGIAAEIADLFTADGKNSPSAHWYLSAANLITGLILAEHDAGGDLRSVVRRLNATALAEYVGLALRQQGAAAELLRAFSNTPEREAGSVVSTARASLSLWMDERVARSTAAGPDSSPHLDFRRFLSKGATLYLVAPVEEAQRCRPLFSALLQSLLRAATALAREQGGILRPRLLLALDEVANFARIPRLSSYVSTGPGQGIHSLLCFHDLAQVEAGYGPEAARTIWNNCRARVLLPGQGDLSTLRQFSASMGNETALYQAPSWNSDGRASRSQQRVAKPLCSPDALRRMDRPVLIYGAAPPARLRARRWDQVPSWRRAVEACPGPDPPSPPPRLIHPGRPPLRRSSSHPPPATFLEVCFVHCALKPGRGHIGEPGLRRPAGQPLPRA